VIALHPIVLEGHGVRLEPMAPEHREAIAAAAADGTLWDLYYTTVPRPEETAAYIAHALEGQAAGHMLPWVVRELASDTIVGSTRYHDAIPTAHRVEIGYTFYARRWQKTWLNSACKLLLLTHAFEGLGCGAVGLRTDVLNRNSQAAIERLGAAKDGVIRHNMLRRDGTVRDTVMYSIVAAEWPAVRDRLLVRLARYTASGALLAGR
jgi:RimJ/RimL family protein N-acetyltransferase